MQQKDANPIQPRPLSQRMIEQLMDCHERDLINQPPLNASSAHAHGLIRRKLVSVEPYINEKGKMIMSIYITCRGKKLLEGQSRRFLTCHQ